MTERLKRRDRRDLRDTRPRGAAIAVTMTTKKTGKSAACLLDEHDHLVFSDGVRSSHPVSPKLAAELRGKAAKAGDDWRGQALAFVARFAKNNFSKATTDWHMKTYKQCLDSSQSKAEANRKYRLAGVAYEAKVTAERRRQITRLANAQLRIAEAEDDLERGA